MGLAVERHAALVPKLYVRLVVVPSVLYVERADSMQCGCHLRERLSHTSHCNVYGVLRRNCYRLQCSFKLVVRNVCVTGAFHRVCVPTQHTATSSHRSVEQFHRDDHMQPASTHDAQSVGVKHSQVSWLVLVVVFCRDSRFIINYQLSVLHLIGWSANVLSLSSIDTVEHTLYGSSIPALEELWIARSSLQLFSNPIWNA